MKHYGLFCLLNLFGFLLCQGQYSVDWLKTNGSTSSDGINQMIRTNDGNVLVAGYFSDSISIEGTEFIPEGANDFFIQKLDTAGVILWSKVFEGDTREFVSGLVQDENSNIYMVGSFQGSVDFNSREDSVGYISEGGNDGFILKLDQDGEFIWVNTIGGIGSDGFTGVAIEGQRLMVCGTYEGDVDLDPSSDTVIYTSSTLSSRSLAVQEYDLDGLLQWTETWNSTSRFIGGSSLFQGSDIAINSVGNTIVSGTFSGKGDFDPSEDSLMINSPNGTTGFLISLDENNDFLWAGALEGTSISSINDINTDSQGAIYVTGFFKDSMDFDLSTDSVIVTSAGQYDIFLLKVSSDGVFEWVKTYGNTSFDNGRMIDIDDDDNVYLVGEFLKTIDFNGGAQNGIFTPDAGYGGFILKLTSSGDFLLANVTLGNGSSYVQTVLATSPFSYMAAGRYLDTVDFDSGIDSISSISLGSTDFFLMKLSDPDVVTQVGTNSIDVLDQVSWVNDQFKLESSNEDIIELSIYNSIGKEILNVPELSNSIIDQRIEAPLGMYIVKMAKGNSKTTSVIRVLKL